MVYEAEQVTPRRLVALKALRVGSLDADEALRRFALEAEVLARLQHPGIAQIHEAGFGDEIGEGPAWIAMELVNGKAIVAAACERRLDRVARLKLFLQVCDAVSFAHRRGVIHRDLKPNNILLAEPEADAIGDAALGRTKVLDFGVARVLGDAWEGATALTSPGQLVGTLPYMSPEQVSGDPDAVDVRTDVYALGVILFELLTERRPHDLKGKNVVDAIATVRDADPLLLGAVDPTLRGDLEAIVQQALTKEPRRRYQSVQDLALDIERHLRGAPVEARADARLCVLARQARRHRWPLALALTIIMAILSVSGRSACSFSPDGTRLAVADGFGAVEIVDGRTGRLLFYPPQHRARVRSLVYSPDGTILATAGDDRVLWLSDASSGALIGRVEGVDPPTPQSLAFAPDGRRLVVTCYDRTAKVYSVPELHLLASMPLGTNQGLSVAWSPDGSSIASTDRDQMVRVRTPDGALLAERSVSPYTPWTVAYSPDGRRLAVGSWARNIEILDVSGLGLLHTLTGPSGLITQIGWTAGERAERPLLYASSADGAVRVWNVETDRVLFELAPFLSSDMTSCAISADGTQLAAAGAWGETAVWDLTRWDLWARRTVLRVGGRWAAVRRRRAVRTARCNSLSVRNRRAERR